MITITSTYNFTTTDFFNYLDKELTTTIKTARGNQFPVKLTKGTIFNQNGIQTEILTYQRGKIYSAKMTENNRQVIVSYETIPQKSGVKIKLSEELTNLNKTQSKNKIVNWLVKLRLKRQAQQQLNSIAAEVKASFKYNH